MTLQASRSSKVVDFGCILGTNRKHVYDFLFDLNSNLDPILPRFRDITAFVRRKYRGTPFPQTESQHNSFKLLWPLCTTVRKATFSLGVPLGVDP